MNVASVSRPSPAVPLQSPLAAGALRSAAPAEQRAAVGAQFEAILIRQMLGPTLTSMLGAEESPAAGIYGDLLAETMATQLAAGRGLGLGRLLETQLAPAGETTARAPQPFPHP